MPGMPMFAYVPRGPIVTPRGPMLAVGQAKGTATHGSERPQAPPLAGRSSVRLADDSFHTAAVLSPGYLTWRLNAQLAPFARQFEQP